MSLNESQGVRASWLKGLLGGQSIRMRLMALLLSLVIVSVILVAYLSVRSILDTGENARDASGAVLRAQAEERLGQVTRDAAEKNDLLLDQVRKDAELAAQYAEQVLERPDAFASEVYWSAQDRMFVGPDGQYMNGKDDITSAFVPNSVEIDDEARSTLEAAAYLDFVFPSIYENDPNTVAIFFGTRENFVRYYPNIDLGNILPPDFAISQRPPYLRASEESNPERVGVWTPIYEDATGQGLMVTAVAPIYDSQDAFKGFIGIDVTLSDIGASVEAINLVADSYSFMVDDKGRAIALPDRGYQDILGRPRASGEFGIDLSAAVRPEFAPVLQEMMAGSSGFQSINVDGQEIFLAYAPMPSAGWSFATVVEADRMFSAVDALEKELQASSQTLVLNRILPAGGLILLLALVAGFLATNRLVQPLRQLANAARQIGAGDMSVRVQVRSKDEIGVLANTFNTMVDKLGGLLTDLQTQSQALEERTRELEASQRVTFAASEHANPDDLLDLVVNLIRDQFDLYHTQVYIVDEKQGAAMLRQSTGYAGRQLLQRGHHIPLDRPALVTRAIKEGQPVLVDDVSQAPDFMPNPLLPETRSELVVPLKVGGKVIGALDAQDRAPGRFSESTIALFQTMTDQVAFLFENSALIEQVNERSKALTLFTNQLRTAADIARRLGAVLDPEQLLDQLVGLLQSRFGLYHAHVYMVDEAANKLVVRAGSGEVGKVLRERGHSISLDAEKSLVARAARERQAVLVDDTTLVSDFMPNPLLPQTRSEMAVPLIFGDKVIGVLDVQDDQAHRFTQADVDTFGTLAGQVATALQTAGAFEQTRLRLQVSQALASAQTEDQVLDVLAEQSGLYPQASVDIMLLEQGEGEELTMVSRRSQSFSSGVPATPQGTRYPASQFPLVNLITPSTLFVSPHVLRDERVDEGARAIASQEGWVSMAIVPITASGNWLGVVVTTSKQEAYFDSSKLALYQTLAEQGATTLQIARLNQATLAEKAFSDAVLNSLPTTFFMFDSQGNLARWNNRFLEAAGLSVEEVKGVQLTDFVVPEDQQVALAAMQKVLTEGQAEMEVRTFSKDRGVVPFHLAASRMIADGQVYLLGAGIDITERKQAEVALRENEEKFRALYESAPDALMLFTNEGFFDCNLRTLETFGFESKEQFIATHPGQLSPPFQPDGQDSMSASKEQIQIAYEQGYNHFEWVHRRANGQDFPAEVLTSAFSMGGQQVLQATVRDITERKQAEQAIKESEERFRDVALSTSDWVWETNAQGQYTYCSEKVVDVLGYTAEEMLGKTPFDFMRPDQVARVGELFGEIVANKRVIKDLENWNVTKDGREVCLLTNGVPMLDQDGNLLGFRGVDSDITERKQAEEAVRIFQSLADNAADSITMSDLQGIVTYANRASYKLLGYDYEQENLVGTQVAKPVAEEDAARQQQIVQQLMTQGGGWSSEEKSVRKDGSLVDIAVTMFAVQDQAGRPVGIASIARDITERKQSQERLDGLNHLREDLIASATLEDKLKRITDGVVKIFDADFARVWITQPGDRCEAGCIHAGVTEGPHVCRFRDRCLHLKASSGRYTHLDGEVHQRVPFGCYKIGRVASEQDPKFITNDAGHDPRVHNNEWASQLGLVSFAGYRLMSSEGKAIGVLALFSKHPIRAAEDALLETLADSTSKVIQMEQAQAERERFTLQLSTAADIAGRVSAILDPDKLLTTVITQLKERFNLYYAHVYTLDKHTLRLRAGYGEAGQIMLERGHSIPLEREQSLVASAARTASIVVAHDVTKAPNFMPNELLPDTHSEVAVPLVVGDQVLGVFDVQHNQSNYFTQADLNVFQTLAGQIATALQNASLYDETQKAAERLREVDKLKTEFLSNMSHELRTPLNSIIGYAELMLMNLSGQLDDQTMNDAQAIMDNGQHLLHMINDILDLAKIEAGRLTLNMDEFEVAPLLEELVTTNSGLLVNKPVELALEVEEDLPLLTADRVRLSQVVTNLISNAIKFTEQGKVTLRAFCQDEHICIQVQDTGVGMAEQDLDVIFDRFRQVDGSNARRAEGSGLGLSITNHLVRLHGGAIVVQSKLGEGSTFTVRLPLQRQEAQNAD